MIWTILLVILQIIMWIFIVIFGLIFLLLFLVLFLCVMPVRYKIRASTMNETEAWVHVSYLLRLVTFAYEYREGKGVSTLRIAGFRLGTESGAKKEEDLDKPKKQKREGIFKLTRSKKKSKTEPEEKPDEKPKKKSDGFIKKVKAVLTYPQGKTIIKLVFEALRRMGRVILPKQLRVTGQIGFADPSATGMFVGAYEALTGALRLRHKVSLCGDFTAESTVVRLDITARGSISVARLSVPVIWLLLKKPIRKLIKDIMRKED